MAEPPQQRRYGFLGTRHDRQSVRRLPDLAPLLQPGRRAQFLCRRGGAQSARARTGGEEPEYRYGHGSPDRRQR